MYTYLTSHVADIYHHIFNFSSFYDPRQKRWYAWLAKFFLSSAIIIIIIIICSKKNKGVILKGGMFVSDSYRASVKSLSSQSPSLLGGSRNEIGVRRVKSVNVNPAHQV